MTSADLHCQICTLKGIVVLVVASNIESWLLLHESGHSSSDCCIVAAIDKGHVSDDVLKASDLLSITAGDER